MAHRGSHNRGKSLSRRWPWKAWIILMLWKRNLHECDKLATQADHDRWLSRITPRFGVLADGVIIDRDFVSADELSSMLRCCHTLARSMQMGLREDRTCYVISITVIWKTMWWDYFEKVSIVDKRRAPSTPCGTWVKSALSRCGCHLIWSSLHLASKPLPAWNTNLKTCQEELLSLGIDQAKGYWEVKKDLDQWQFGWSSDEMGDQGIIPAEKDSW